MNGTRSHTDLIVLGAFSLWANMLGIGFAALAAVKNRQKQIASNASVAERRQLENARALAQASIVLFFMSWLGLFVMAAGHGRKWREQRHSITPTSARQQGRV